MSVNLTSYRAVRTATFVRLHIDEYRTTSGGAYTNQTLRFSDHDQAFTINAETYTPLGRLMGVTNTTSELRSTNDAVTITLSGIPNSSIAEIVHSKLKGSEIRIYRAYFTEAGVQIGTTQERWIGAVNGYNLEEEFDVIAHEATNTVQINGLSTIGLLQQKLSGRRTNPESMQKYFSADTSFDRVPTLIGSQFDFGVQR